MNFVFCRPPSSTPEARSVFDDYSELYFLPAKGGYTKNIGGSKSFSTHTNENEENLERVARQRRRSVGDIADYMQLVNTIEVINNCLLRTVSNLSTKNKQPDESIEFLMTFTLEALFGRGKYEREKSLLYFLLVNVELSQHMRKQGIWMVGQPKGDRSSVTVKKSDLKSLNVRDQALQRAWRQHKLLSKIDW